MLLWCLVSCAVVSTRSLLLCVLPLADWCAGWFAAVGCAAGPSPCEDLCQQLGAHGLRCAGQDAGAVTTGVWVWVSVF